MEISNLFLYRYNLYFSVNCINEEYDLPNLVTNDENFPTKVAVLRDLSEADLKDIQNNKMINDVIHIAQKILKNQFQHANGLQDPTLGQNMSFSVMKNTPFVQILHNGKSHWVAISTYNCNDGEVHLMDSFFSGKISNHLKRQICAIMKCSSSTLSIKAIPVQQQKNFVDCGLYAIYFVYTILSNGSFTNNILENKMRSHLLDCFTKGKFIGFPMDECLSKRNTEKIISLELFCSCRMPWFMGDSKKYNMQMVECSSCNEWFHRMCERISDDCFLKKFKDSNWFCYICSNKK